MVVRRMPTHASSEVKLSIAGNGFYLHVASLTCLLYGLDWLSFALFIYHLKSRTLIYIYIYTCHVFVCWRGSREAVFERAYMCRYYANLHLMCGLVNLHFLHRLESKGCTSHLAGRC